MSRWVRILEALQNQRPTRKSVLAKLVVQTAGAAAILVIAYARLASVIAAPRVLNPAVLAVARRRPPMNAVAERVAARSSRK